MEKLVKVNGIHKYYPGVHALNDVSLDFEKGEIHGLVGENGAGKSTLKNVLSGVVSHDKGEYYFEGELVAFSNTREAIAKGINVIHQEISLVDSITIAENLFVGHFPVKNKVFLDGGKMLEDAKMVLKEVGLDIDPGLKTEFLSTAQKQLVEIARAIHNEGKLLIMDEPTSALAPTEISNLHRIMLDLKSKGMTIVYITHKMDEIFEVTDRITVLRDGCFVATKKTNEVSRENLIAMMVGRKVSEIFNRTPSNIGDPVLEVEGLSNYKVKDISFTIRSGEIVGFSGLLGAGRTEMAKAVFGFDSRDEGVVKICGQVVPPKSTSASRKLGMGFVSEDRKLEGIFQFLSVKDNMSIVALPNISKNGVVDFRKEDELVAEGIKNLNVKTSSDKTLIATLSGGNQQKVILARWLINEGIKVLIIDEPTRGIDVGSKAEIYGILDQLASEGLAIVVISSEMPEIINVCDRVYVMRNGQISAELQRNELTQERLMECAIL